MMKNISILSLAQAHSSLQKKIYLNFLNYYGIDVKNEEVDDLVFLVNELYKETNSINIFDNFYVGYKIPQISKEFDLLRLGDNCIVNIEIKNKSTIDKIKKQLIRNKYYLNYVGKSIKLFTYVVNENQLYYLDYNNDIKKDNIINLVQLLKEQNDYKFLKAENLFNPSDYLVSPFNYTKRFINDEYFLTSHQEKVKNDVLNTINDHTTYKFLSIIGSAGTGKTLLVYDIAREIIGIKKRVLIIHCGYLNNGQEALKSDYGWEIIPIKDYGKINMTMYDVFIIDEAQRIYSNQLEEIVNTVKSIKGKCIFSYDKLQTLSNSEEIRNIDLKINSIESVVSHKLTEKIRTNKEIASFIKALFSSKNGLLAISSG